MSLPNHSSRIIESSLGYAKPFRIEVAPSKLSFGNIVMNGTSVPRQLVVTNVGVLPVKIGQISTSGAFASSSNAPTWLNPGQSFLIDVVFRPRNEGISIGGVYVDTNDAAGTEYASLIGYGYVAGTDPGGGEGGGSEGGILPKYWNFTGDGESNGFPLDGADAYDKLLYDTYVELTPGGRDFVGVNPTDFTIALPTLELPAMMSFSGAPLAEGIMGYTILRGYAKPYVGPPPIETVAPEVITDPITDGEVIDHTRQNTLLVINTETPITIYIRKKAGDDSLDWKDGEFFSVMQRGNGSVTLAVEGNPPDTLFPALDFIATTRGKNCTISASCINADADQWMISGDMRRQTASTDRHSIDLMDRTVLIGSSMQVGTNKDSYVLPFGFKVDPIVDGGLFASLMVAQTGGNIFTADLLRNGVSVLASKLVINNGTKTTKGAVTPPTFVAGGDTYSEGDELTLSINQVGDGTARGLRVYLTGQRI